MYENKLFVEKEMPHALGINETKLDENFSEDGIAEKSIELKIQNIKPIIVTTLYRPPGKTVEVFGFIENLVHKLDDESKEYITIGDNVIC